MLCNGWAPMANQHAGTLGSCLQTPLISLGRPVPCLKLELEELYPWLMLMSPCLLSTSLVRLSCTEMQTVSCNSPQATTGSNRKLVQGVEIAALWISWRLLRLFVGLCWAFQMSHKVEILSIGNILVKHLMWNPRKKKNSPASTSHSFVCSPPWNRAHLLLADP